MSTGTTLNYLYVRPRNYTYLKADLINWDRIRRFALDSITLGDHVVGDFSNTLSLKVRVSELTSRLVAISQKGTRGSTLKNLVVMKIRLLTYVFLISVTTACSSRGITQTINSTVNVAESQDSKKDQNQNQDLQKQLEQITTAAKGKVGVAAVVLETGETVSLNPRDHFPMQSVYKFPIGMAVLRQVDAGKIKLEQKVQVAKSDLPDAGQYSPIRDKYPDGVELSVNELVRFAVSESDSTASDMLMRLAGGAGAVQAYLTELKITEWIVLNTEKEFSQDWQMQYRNWASPDGAVALLRALHEGKALSETSRALVLKLLTETTRGPKRLKGLLPAGTLVAHKTGSSGSRNGVTAATNDIGIITLPNGRHVAIAVFVSDSPADEATREGVIAKVARAVWERFATD